jgi:hypothetical protein
MQKLIMSKLIISTALLALLIGGPAAMAQTGSKTGTSGAANQSPSGREAPIGHRQPRAGDVPSEKNLSDPNNPFNKEDAALDRKIKSICRGC